MYRKEKREQGQKMQTITGLWSFRQLSLCKNRETVKSNIKLNNIKTKIITTGTDINCLYFCQVVELKFVNPQQRGAGQSLSARQSRVRFLMGPKPALGVNGLA